MSDRTIDIPVDAAKDIAQRYGYDQVVIMARKVGDGGREHVTTAGVDAQHCAVAAHVGEFLRTKVMGWPCQPHEAVLQEVGRERERQMAVEGWTPEHDDEHAGGELAQAAGCYALHAGQSAPAQVRPGYAPQDWPWDAKWWKPKDRRRDLIRAAALIIAEIERLDRGGKSAERP